MNIESNPADLNDKNQNTAQSGSSVPTPLDGRERITFSAERVSMTPELAEALLQRNTLNRPFSKSLAKKYADEMASGNWHFTGDPIQVSVSGRLLNGQHRLQACVDSGTPFDVTLIMGLPDELFPFIDVGKKRTDGDVLSIGGYSDRALSSTIQRIFQMKGYNNKPPAHEKLEFMRKNAEGLKLATEVAGKIKVALNVPISSVASVFYLGAEKNFPKTVEFFEKLETGDGLVTGSPIKALRDRWMQMGASAGQFHTEARVIGLKALISYINGESVSRLRFSRSEGFPTL